MGKLVVWNLWVILPFIERLEAHVEKVLKMEDSVEMQR